MLDRVNMEYIESTVAVEVEAEEAAVNVKLSSKSTAFLSSPIVYKRSARRIDTAAVVRDEGPVEAEMTS
jgi:hypothetical protein